MKTCILCFICFCFSASSFAQDFRSYKGLIKLPPFPEETKIHLKADINLVDLINSEDYFELQRQYELNKGHLVIDIAKTITEAELDFFRNRRLAFDKSVRNFINKYQREMGIDFVIVKTRDMIKNLFELGKYKEAYETSDYFLNQIEPVNFFNKKEVTEELEYQKNLSKSLMSYSPKQAVFYENDSVEVPLAFNRVGGGYWMYVNASVNGNESIPFLFDTGAESNCFIHEKYVKQYNIRLLDSTETTVKDALSTMLKAKMGILDSLSLGNVSIYNIPVIILPENEELQPTVDNLINVPDSLKHISQAIIGWKLMETIGEIQIYPQEKKMILVKSDSLENKIGNMMLYHGKLPFIELELNNKRLNFLLDTGSSLTSLYSNYYKDNEEWILKLLNENEGNVRGIGGSTKMKIFVLPHLYPQLDNIPFDLKNVRIYPDEIRTQVWGCLGVDFISQFKKVTLNFKNTHIEVEKERFSRILER